MAVGMPEPHRKPCRRLARCPRTGTIADVRTSWLVLIVAVYVSLDVANPLMPGALAFGVEDSVEIRQAERFRGHDDAAPVPTMPPLERAARTSQITGRWAPTVDVPRSWALHAPLARSSLSVLAPPSPDH
jgi:hypothetical protein